MSASELLGTVIYSGALIDVLIISSRADRCCTVRVHRIAYVLGVSESSAPLRNHTSIIFALSPFLLKACQHGRARRKEALHGDSFA